MSDRSPVVVAALHEEMAPFVSKTDARRIGSPRGSKGGNPRIYRGESGGRAVVAAVLGDGAGPARRRTERLFDLIEPERLLLIGIAGGLSDDLSVGSLLQATSIRSPGDGREWRARTSLLEGLEPGVVISSNRVLSTTQSKRERLEQAGLPARCAVDLESWSVVGAAQAAGVPWTVVRAITDASHEDLPLDFGAMSNEEGRVVRSKVILALLRHPVALRGVLEMRFRVRSCARDLALVAERWLLTGEGVC